MATTVQLSTATTPYTVYGNRAAGTPSLLKKGLILPVKKTRITSMPDVLDVHGSEPIAWSYQDGILGLNVRVEKPTEADFQAELAALDAVLEQWTYTATVTLGGAVLPAWRCRVGSWEYIEATRREVISGQPVVEEIAITIPVYPIPEA